MRLLKQLLSRPVNVLAGRGGKHRIPLKRKSGLLLAIMALLLVSRFSYGAPVQLISVKETRAGKVIATVGVFTAEPVTPSDFWLRFDGKYAVRSKKVESAQSASLETPIILGIDQGGAMGQPAIQQVHEALKRVVSGPAFGANVALWVFDSEIKKIHSFSDISKLEEGINQIGVPVGRADKTKLYEAITLALSELHSYPTHGLKRLVLITAGRDDGSSISEQSVIDEANTAGIVIDAIGLGNVSDAASRLLGRLASDTNGHYATDVGDISQLADALRKLLSWTPSRVVEVVFEYDPSVEGHKAHAAQLEFVPNGKRILLPVRNALIFPREGPLSGEGLPYDPAIGEENARDLILVWVSVGLTGFIAAYTMSRILRKRREKRQSEAG
jgi:von Willebrand factor type A domain